MRDDFGPGLGTRRRPPRLRFSTVAMAVVAAAVIVFAVLAQGPVSSDHESSWNSGSWGLKRRLPLPGAIPTPEAQAAEAPTPTERVASSDIAARPHDAFALTVTYVYDGDTIEARVAHPNEVVTTARPIRIRLIGIDAPEGAPTPECWADEARSRLAELLPEGSTVWAMPDTDTWDDYDRRLFNLWTGDGRFVNLELVAAGAAETMRVWPNVEYDDLLTAAQARAEASRAGQWGACG